jgi:hypothetical protein
MSLTLDENKNLNLIPINGSCRDSRRAVCAGLLHIGRFCDLEPITPPISQVFIAVLVNSNPIKWENNSPPTHLHAIAEIFLFDAIRAAIDS